MATAYTSLLGLALPVTGELQGTWGTTVNDSITSLLDTAVAGTTTLSTDGDVTLSTTTGASNQARQAILLCSGARTALRTITAPAQSKIYTVINATTGGFSVKLVGVGPTTGVTVVAGESALVAWNGSDFIKISNTGGAASFTNVTVSGTTTLSGLTASTALALNGSKEVVSVTNTGTGNNVLSASPTLTGTIGGASMTLSSLTSGRVTYAGASGLLQDSANFTFNGTDLTVSGAVNAGSVNATTLDLTNLEVTNIKAKDGTASASIADSTGVMSLVSNPVLSGGTANGVLYLNGSKVATSGSALTFDGTNLGVGGAASQRLHVQNAGALIGLLQNTASTADARYRIQNTGGSSDWGVDGTGTYFQDNNSRPFLWFTGGSEQMRLTSTGLGIGTSSPGYKLSVNGAASGTVANIGYNGDLGTGFYIGVNHASNLVQLYASGSANKSMAFYTGATEVMRYDTSGNLGLGVTPSAWGSILKPIQLGDAFSYVAGRTDGVRQVWLGSNSYFNGTNWIYGLSSPAAQYYQNDGIHIWNTAPSGTAGNTISFTQVMTLDSSGNLGIGTSSPGQKLTVQGGLNVTSSATLPAAQGSMLFSYESTVNRCYMGDGTGYSFAFSKRSASTTTDLMTLTDTGNLGIGTSSPAYKLDIGGTNPRIRINETTGFVLTSYVNTGGSFDVGRDNSAGLISGAAYAGFLNVGGAYPLIFNTNGAERMRLDSSGNLGLGVTPSAWGSNRIAAQVVGASLAGVVGSNAIAELSANRFINSSGQDIYVSSTAASVYQQATGSHIWYTAPSGTAGNAISFTQAMTLDASGNLLVGTTNAELGAGFGNIQIQGSSGAIVQAQTGAGTVKCAISTDSANGYVGTRTNHPVLFTTNNTERARITSGGDLLVGTTTSYGSRKFEVRGGATATFLSTFGNTNSNPLGVQIYYDGYDPNGTGNEFLNCNGNGTVRATIRSNGGLANYQSNNVDLSDSRTKKDIAPAASMWSKIGALEIVTYKYKDQTHDDINVGVIAQQVEQVEPVWVDSDGFGETPEDGVPLKTVYTKDITFAAIKALQEAMTRIEQLEARVAALEAK